MPEIVAMENESAQVLWHANHPKQGAATFPFSKNTFARSESGWRCGYTPWVFAAGVW